MFLFGTYGSQKNIMASTTLHFFHLNHHHHNQISTNPSLKILHFPIKCTSNSNSNSDPNPSSLPPPSPPLQQPPPASTDDKDDTLPFISTAEMHTDLSFPIEKRRNSEIIRDRKSRRELAKREPPNYEIGWKRTKEINLEKPIGYEIMDFLDKLLDLMDREFGSAELLEKVGEIVTERAREEAEDLRDEGKVEDRMVTELFRVLKLIEMDLAMVKAAVKEETLRERIEQAKARCRQAILVASSF